MCWTTDDPLHRGIYAMPEESELMEINKFFAIIQQVYPLCYILSGQKRKRVVNTNYPNEFLQLVCYSIITLFLGSGGYIISSPLD